MRSLGIVCMATVIAAGCAAETAADSIASTIPPATTTSSSPTTTSTTTTTTPTTTTTVPSTTTTTLHPVVKTVAGSWRARSWNPRVDGWADLHVTDAGLFRLTNPQADDMALATGRFDFEDETVSVFLGLVVWPGCDGHAVFTWELDGEDTLHFSTVEDSCRDIALALATHPWHRQD